MKRLTAAILLVITGVVGVEVVAEAAQPPTSLEVPDGVFGSSVTATISPTSYRFAHAACEQIIDGGTVTVYEQWVTIVAGQAVFQLGPTAKWRSGDAVCVADVGKLTGGKWTAVVSDDFHVTDPG